MRYEDLSVTFKSKSSSETSVCFAPVAMTGVSHDTVMKFHQVELMSLRPVIGTEGKTVIFDSFSTPIL